MKLFKIPLLLIWRLWFYILMFVSLLIFFPFLLIFTIKEEHYPIFWKFARLISKILIYGMGFRIDLTADEKIDVDKSYMFCPNHASLLDPFVLIVLSKRPIVFVGKKELVKIPVFGFFYKRTVIMVDRSSVESRKRVFEMAKKRLQNGVSMAIFPEGLVPEEDVILAPFKKGAFSLAIEFEIPIIPQVYYDCKRFFSWDIFKGRPGVLRVHQFKFIETKGLNVLEDMKVLKNKTFNIIFEALQADKKYMKDTNRKI
ncbi:1-acyl-sn-glycerol-3-phosphate acyltransferase [Polaribacter sp. KT 15]|uniref:lysophospholipid acyltransferase family protein n=1 Tax=Polaribacter sp. KT 15 TaxID=1896175 RepID=UPI000909A7DB|nr:lysophospholipid acyltransferase family protein [Polaribacter sp. KT 15]SHM87467.1 1-acyl-sn-glycerol-3-phosphate acyltransferase [Polaribacter sp. KT 15]